MHAACQGPFADLQAAGRADQEVLLWTNGPSMQQQHTGMQLLG